ncbi:MAG TPA: hypothetical protein VN999_17745 [Thermoanaerobaculia bacterium]|nr:hypothetical protein [Thermoanaerobaculia bacterium]
MSDLEDALHVLCLEIAFIWKNPRLLGSPYESQPEIVKTMAEDGAPLLSKTRRPVRGNKAVKVQICKESFEGARLFESLVRQALFDSWLTYGSDPEVVKARLPIHDKLKTVLSILAEIPGLRERLFEAIGFKHFEPEEVRRRMFEDDRESVWNFVLATAMGKALAASGFSVEMKHDFTKWAEVASLVATDFEELAARRRQSYEAFVGFNSPLLDEDGHIPVAELTVYGEPVTLSLLSVSDALLTRLRRNSPDIPFSDINTALSFRFSVDVDAPVEDYLRWYSAATLIAERSTDILRLLCEDDVGVLAMEILETEWATPTIRKTYENTYRSDLSLYQPKRFRFAPSNAQVVTRNQIQELCDLLPDHVCDTVGVRGFSAAMRRFRFSSERYERSDPEQLLEMAIALEAILLNDTDARYELSYRLRLRAARLLADDLEERKRISDLLGDLYSLRSRIAHGQTLEGMKDKERATLDRVFREAPKIVRMLLLKIMKESALKDLSREELAIWWRNLELS